jgi:hypothetical protein
MADQFICTKRRPAQAARHPAATHQRPRLVGRVLRSYGLVCFRPEGGSGYTDRQVYERASLGGGLGYSEHHLRAIWDRSPFSVRVLRQMAKTDGQGPYFGEDFLWALLATKDAAGSP